MLVQLISIKNNSEKGSLRNFFTNFLETLSIYKIGFKLHFLIENKILKIFLDFSTDEEQIVENFLHTVNFSHYYDYIIVEEYSFKNFSNYSTIVREIRSYNNFKKLVMNSLKSDLFVTIKNDILSKIDIPNKKEYYGYSQVNEFFINDILNILSDEQYHFEIDFVPVNYDTSDEENFLKNSEVFFRNILENGIVAFSKEKFDIGILKNATIQDKFEDIHLQSIYKDIKKLYISFLKEDKFFFKIKLFGKNGEDIQKRLTLINNIIFKNGTRVIKNKDFVNIQRVELLFSKSEIQNIFQLPSLDNEHKLNLILSGNKTFHFTKLDKISNFIYSLNKENEVNYCLAEDCDISIIQTNKINKKLTFSKDFDTLFISFDEINQQNVSILIENMVIAFIKTNIDSIKVVNINNKLYNILENIPKLKKFSIFQNITENESIKKYLHFLIKQARNRVELLSSSKPTIIEYNKTSFVKEELYIIMIDYDTLNHMEDAIKQNFYDIVVNANKVGIYFIIYGNLPKKLIKLSTRDIFLYFENRNLYIDKNEKIEFISFKNIDINKEINFIKEYIENKSEFKNFLSIPIGVSPELKDEISFELGEKSEAYHALIVGTIGTGKTTLLNNIITRIAEKYTSNEIQLILMDYKASGVEFGIYKNHPNVKQIFLDNTSYDNFMKVFNDLKYEMKERGRLFAKYNVTKIDTYNQLEDVKKLPRIILIIDEIQKLFANLVDSIDYINELKQLVKESRSMGIALIFATQTLANLRLSDVISQIRLRISFKLADFKDTSEVFNISNKAPLYLKRFECIYNNGYGIEDDNIRVSTYPEYISRDRLDEYFFEIIKKRDKDNYIKPVIIHPSENNNTQNTSLLQNTSSIMEKIESTIIDKERMKKINDDWNSLLEEDKI